MKYQILFSNRAIKDLNKIDKTDKNRIKEKLLILSEDPIKNAKKLSDPKIGTYRFRIGDYRVVFDIDGTNIVILRIGHRKNIYKD